VSPRGWRALFAGSLGTLLLAGAAAGATRWERRIALAAEALEEGNAARALILASVPPERATHATHYLRGTSLLSLGLYDEAADALADAALGTADVELRRRALHNLALASLRLAAAAPRPARELHARAAVEAARAALRLDPSSAPARWNLALAHRLAGGDRAPSAGDEGAIRLGGGAAAAGPIETGAALSAAEAAGILDALRADEATELSRGVARLLRADAARTPPGGRPW
jgi:hypothetical protein